MAFKEGQRVVATAGPQQDERGVVCYVNADGTVCVDFDKAGRVLNVSPDQLEPISSSPSKTRKRDSKGRFVKG